MSSVKKSLRLNGAMLFLSCVLAACGGASDNTSAPPPQVPLPSPTLPTPAEQKINSILASKSELSPGETVQLRATTLNLNKVDWKITAGNGQLKVTSDLTATYTASENASDEQVAITASGPAGVQSQSISLHVLAPPLKFRDLGTAYVAADGLTITVRSITPTLIGDKWKYIVEYELKNSSPNIISEGQFQMYGPSGITDYQSGFFGSLLPGEKRSRTAEFVTSEERPFDVLAYVDEFRSTRPPTDALLWRVRALSQVLSGKSFFPIDKGVKKFQHISMISDSGLNDSSIIAGSYVNIPEYVPTYFPVDGYIAKIDNNAVVWIKSIEKSDVDTNIRSMKTDRYGNIYVIITENDRGPSNANAVSKLRSYDADGVMRWETFLDSEDIIQEIAIGSNDTVAVAAGAIYSFDISGKQLWSRPIPFDNQFTSKYYQSFAVANDGSVYIVASYITTPSSSGPDASYLLKYSSSGGSESQTKILPYDNTTTSHFQAKTLLDGTTAIMWQRYATNQGRVIVEYNSNGQQTNTREESNSVVDPRCFGARLRPVDDAEKYFVPLGSYESWPNSNIAIFSFCSRDEKLVKEVSYSPPAGVFGMDVSHINASGNVLSLGWREIGSSRGMRSLEGFYLNFSLNTDY